MKQVADRGATAMTTVTETTTETATEKFIQGICREGATGTKVHAAGMKLQQSNDLMYRSCGGWKTVVTYPSCVAWNNNGFRQQKFHGFRETQDFSQVTCKNCLRQLGLDK